MTALFVAVVAHAHLRMNSDYNSQFGRATEENRLRIQHEVKLDVPTIGYYSWSFGNYRNETLFLDNCKLHDGADYFFFIDRTNISSRKWKLRLRRPDMINETSSRLESSRLASKFMKFNLPDELRKYDYVFSFDASVCKKKKLRTQVPSPNELQALVRRWPETCLFAYENPYRKTVREEIKFTIQSGQENREAGEEWLTILQRTNFRDSWPLIETRMFFRNNRCSAVDDAFHATFDAEITRGLNRDQNIFTVVAPKFLNSTDVLVFKSYKDFRSLPSNATSSSLAAVVARP